MSRKMTSICSKSLEDDFPSEISLVLILVVFLIFYSSFEIYSIIQTFVSNNLVH